MLGVFKLNGSIDALRILLVNQLTWNTDTIEDHVLDEVFHRTLYPLVFGTSDIKAFWHSL
jgi:hypothetical protein